LPDRHISRHQRRLQSGEPAMRATGRGTILTLAVFVVLAAFLFYRLQVILLPFVISGLLAYICNPLINRMASSTGLSRSYCAVATFVMLVSIATLVGFLGLPPLLREFTRAATDFRGTLASLARAAVGDGNVNFLGHPLNASQLAQSAESAVRDWIGQPGNMLQLGEIAFSTVFGLFLSLLLLFYFLYSGPYMMRGLLWIVPPAQRPLALDLWAKLDPILRRYFVGVLVVVTYAATVAYIGLGVVLHLPHAIFLALLTGFLEMIPMVGPLTAIAIAGIVAVRHAVSIGPIVGYAIYAAALRVSIDQLFGPLALGAAAQLHPVAIIFCFIAGGALFGVAGFILSVPLALVIKTCLAVMYGESSDENEANPE
jgi:predicted PurR-regulated permease PerM